MHFQGKEADIVMISMVASGDIRADSGRLYEQRYNVACSRARDRLYVFHSFAREEVRDNDLRGKLLDHRSHPVGIDAAQVTELRDLCESEFEREVYDELAGRGYRVLPQVRAGGYRIDLVVEGADDRRLAIECDGDQYHGVDRWMDDITRQRVLERMGWRFWRCWASSWIANREDCLTDLLESLQTRGVSPGPGEGAAPEKTSHLVEHRVIEPQTAQVQQAQVPRDGHDAVIVTPADDRRKPQIGTEDRRQVDENVVVEQGVQHHAPYTRLHNSETRPEARIPSRSVEIDDLVTYVDLEQPDDIRSVRITSGSSDPNAGVINDQTPLAEALLGAEVGDDVEAHLPIGTAKFRILEVRPH